MQNFKESREQALTLLKGAIATLEQPATYAIDVRVAHSYIVTAEAYLSCIKERADKQTDPNPILTRNGD